MGANTGAETAAAVAEPEVIFEVKGEAGIITLNRPKALNALNLSMAQALLPQLRAWAKDPAITRVILKGAGEKAFCAGGDVRWVYEEGRAGRAVEALAFFRAEYVVDDYIGSYPKPFVSLIDGICMGGGNGLSVHAPYRVAGDRYLYAMPEVHIGLFPDVGGAHSLPRLPGFVGTYLALTGGRIRGPEAYAAGLATHVVPTAAMPALEAALIAGGDVPATLAAHHVAPGPGSLAPHAGFIAEVFSRPSLGEIIAALEAASGREGPHAAFAAETLAAVRKGCPTTAAIALEQMKRGLGRDLGACLKMDMRIVTHVLQGGNFYEGVRAVLVDRDNAPKWQPPRFEDLTGEEVEAHFAPIPDELELLAPGS